MGRYRTMCRAGVRRPDNGAGFGSRGARSIWTAALWPAAAALALLLAALSGLPRAARAQPLPKSSEIVRIDGLKLDAALKPGESDTLKVDAKILPGWHINSNHPASSDFIPTKLAVTTPAGLKAGAVKYPPADEIAPAFSGGEKLSLFTGALRFSVPLTAASNFKPAGALTVTLSYQPCNDNVCMPPAKVTATMELAPPPPSAAADQPPYPAGILAVAAHGGSSGGAAGGGGSYLAAVFLRHGMLLGLLAVLLGGLALNLTPCVYPLIGVTVAYFGNQGGGPRKIAVLATIYVVGIALTFSAAGVAAALSGGLFGEALQSPWVLAAIAAMLLALAASSFGLFAIRPPRWLMQRAGTARPGYVGALAMGLGMGVVAAPCIGPIVLGLLLMVERSASPAFGFVLFFTLAVGLGLPYIALAMAAGRIRSLPRSGQWLAWVEQLFGFVLAGLALYFLDPIVNGAMVRILPYYAIGAGLFLGFVSPAGRGWRPFAVFRGAVGVLSAGLLAYLLLFAATTPARQLSFAPYDAAALARARAEHKPVVIDFSADWCIPCREMRRTTFRDPAVIEAAAHFVRLQADITETNRRTDHIVSSFAVRGVPTTVFIGRHGRIVKREVGYVGARRFLSDLRTAAEVSTAAAAGGPRKPMSEAAGRGPASL